MKIVPPQSEILAGAIQDNDRDYRGTSFLREGLVQREMDFDDGSAVRLTVADIHTWSLDTKAYLRGMKNILMSQKSVLRVVNYMKDSIK
jgi:carboxyl-terminal processing protease